MRVSTVSKAILAGALLLMATCSPEQIMDPGATAPSVPLTVQASHVDVTAFPTHLWTKEPGIRVGFHTDPDFSGDLPDPDFTKGFHTRYVFRLPDGLLRMYYDAFDFTTNTGEMRSATSTDGLTWTKEEGLRLQDGARLTNVFHAHVIQLGPGLYRMYTEKAVGTGVIVSATSVDGLTWDMEPKTRIAGVDPVVLELPDGSFRMYYRGGFSDLNIRSAISSDGLTWTPEGGTRIPDAREFAAIRLPDGTVIIYYGTGNPAFPAFTAILSARSADGLTFIADLGNRLDPGSHPTHEPLDDGRILTTSVVQFPGAVIRMYYQGSPGNNINELARVFSAVVFLTPEARSEALILEIEALVAAAVLSEDQGAGLIDKLNEVLAKLEVGKTDQGSNQLGAFINQVKALINAGVLSPEQAEPYVDAAEYMISQLSEGA